MLPFLQEWGHPMKKTIGANPYSMPSATVEEAGVEVWASVIKIKT
jgi:hypothetical protein